MVFISVRMIQSCLSRPLFMLWDSKTIFNTVMTTFEWLNEEPGLGKSLASQVAQARN